MCQLTLGIIRKTITLRDFSFSNQPNSSEYLPLVTYTVPLDATFLLVVPLSGYFTILFTPKMDPRL